MTHGKRLNGLVLLTILGMLAVACAAPTPVVVKKPIVQTVVVEKEVPVTVEVRPAKETTLERAKREGVVVLGLNNVPPASQVEARGNITGYSPEIAKLILERLGIPEVDAAVVEWGGLIPGLKAGRFDIITAGMWIKPERCNEVAFSEPEACIGIGAAVKAGNPFNIHSLKDCAANPEIRVGVTAGGYEHTYALNDGVLESQISQFPSGADGIAGVQAGRVDAFILNSAGLKVNVAALEDPGIEIASPFEQPIIDGKAVIVGCGGFAFRKVDTDFVEAFNSEMQKIRESGELKEILMQWGFAEDEVAGFDVTTEQLCTAE